MAIEVTLNNDEREVLSEYLAANDLATTTDLVRREIQRFKEGQRREQLHEMATKIWPNNEPDRSKFT
jgi:hypothetical protein